MGSGAPAAAPSTAYMSDHPTYFLVSSENTTPYFAVRQDAMGAERTYMQQKSYKLSAAPNESHTPHQHTAPHYARLLHH